jgi:hypothetical protein
MRFRMKGGNALRDMSIRAFMTYIRTAVASLFRAEGRTAGEVAAREVPVIAGQVAREGAVLAGQAARQVPVAAGHVGRVVEQVVLPLATRYGQMAIGTLTGFATFAGPAVLSAVGAVGATVFGTLGRALGRSVMTNPEGVRSVLYLLYHGTGLLLRRITTRAAVNAAAAGARPAAQAIGRLVPVGERAVGNAVATAVAEAAAAVRPPIPTTGPITRAFLEDLFAPEHVAVAPKRIAEFFKANPNMKVPSDFLKAVKLPEKVLAQKEGFIRQLISNGRLEGSPADILEVASKYIGQPEAERILAGIANPAIPARAAAEAAIKTIPEGSTRAQEIAKYMMNSLERTVTAEAKLLAEAAADVTPAVTRDGQILRNIMNVFMENYNSLFGPITDKAVLDKFVPSGQNISRVLGTGVTNAGIAAYSTWLNGARESLIRQMPEASRKNFMEVMTPEVMGQFRQGMLRVFAHDAPLAEEVIENFAIHVIPHIERNGGVRIAAGATQPARAAIDIFLAGIRSAPGNASSLLTDLLTSIAGRAARDAASLALSQARYAANLPARILTRVIGGTLTAGVGLFAVMLQGTPNGGGLGQAGRFAGAADGIRDRVYQWFGIQLWENPPHDNTWGQQLAAAGGFENVAAMTAWLATQGRQWLWSNMGYILGSFSAGTAAAFAYFRGPLPAKIRLEPTEEAELAVLVEAGAREIASPSSSLSSSSSSSVSSSSSSSASESVNNGHGGGRKKRRTVRKYR